MHSNLTAISILTVGRLAKVWEAWLQEFGVVSAVRMSRTKMLMPQKKKHKDKKVMRKGSNKKRRVEERSLSSKDEGATDSSLQLDRKLFD